uniref:Tetratricopeptide repeat protein 30 n=1 Tax=Ditylum brightwellii TaxID=49249 RepID=A0A7S2EA66_9STRA|mmetsp:Transcript_2075/g.3311  ORF Transcript_2075/g.3311 Transcript_2075/m.3311 type:complete len:543 (+) Transcript_2075:311-1939(+)
MLQAMIKFEQEEIGAFKTILGRCLEDDPETIIASAAYFFKEGEFNQALNKYFDVQNTLGHQVDLAYNIGLCHYKLKQYDAATKVIKDLIKRGIDEHPELSAGGGDNNGMETKRINNSFALQETHLVEAFNLMAAIEFDKSNLEDAKKALRDLPPRKEEEIDPVTLHNEALIRMDEDATVGFRKLNYLLSNPPFPPETFGNLLLLYCKHEYYDLAADILAENSHLTYNFLSQELFEYLDAAIMVTTSPEEAYRKFDNLSTQYIDRLRKLMRAISAASASRDKDAIEASRIEFDEELKCYIPALMAQARIYWRKEKYTMVESLFRQSAEFCGDHSIWKLNVAHVLFMQQGEKFKDSIRYYNPFVQKCGEKNILEVAAIVLANLCVAYIMTNQNEDAEEIMKSIEKEEERQARNNPQKQFFHSCIVNLVIGTLYCEKGNFEFGVSRICKSLEPYDKKLGADTWFYTKRCFLALAENLSKQMLALKDETVIDIMEFLEDIENNGRDTFTKIEQSKQQFDAMDPTCASNTVAFEARQLRQVLMILTE